MKTIRTNNFVGQVTETNNQSWKLAEKDIADITGMNIDHHNTGEVPNLLLQSSSTLIDALVHEINFITYLRRSKPTAILSHVSKFSVENLDLSLLAHPHGYVRRLMAVIIGLIFEQNSDMFRTSALGRHKNLYLRDKSLFLCRASPAIRNSRPEPLYHVEHAFFHYLPQGMFPSGQRCYLDASKLSNIMVAKEYLRLPDPQDQVIWLEFEDPIIALEVLHELSVDSLKSSPQEEEEKEINISHEEYSSSKTKRKIDTKIKVLSAFKPNSTPKTGTSQDNDDQSQASGMHRIKCFQFFRKQKEQPLSGESQIRGSLNLWIPEEVPSENLSLQRASVTVKRKQTRVKPPQFESVNDSSSFKTFYSTLHKFFPLDGSPIKWNSSSANPTTPDSTDARSNDNTEVPFNQKAVQKGQNFGSYAGEWNLNKSGLDLQVKSPTPTNHQTAQSAKRINIVRNNLSEVSRELKNKKTTQFRAKTTEITSKISGTPFSPAKSGLAANSATRVRRMGTRPEMTPSRTGVEEPGNPNSSTPGSGKNILTAIRSNWQQASPTSTHGGMIRPAAVLRVARSLESSSGIQSRQRRIHVQPSKNT